MNPKQILREFGLNETEALVYLEILKKGHGTATEIASASTLKRPTVYYALEVLEKKGLVASAGHKAGVAHFKAENPSNLEMIITRDKARLANLEKKLKQALPFFPDLDEMPIGTMPKISVYHGIEGLKNLTEKSFATKKKEILSIMPPFKEVESAVDEDYMRYYLEERNKRGIKTKSIWVDFPKNSEFSKHKKFMREVRIAPRQLAKQFKIGIDIYDQHVVFVAALPEMIGIDISSFTLSESMRAIWKIVWLISKPI